MNFLLRDDKFFLFFLFLKIKYYVKKITHNTVH